MLVLLLFAFLSGLVTIFAPCIWPLLPIVLSATTTGGKSKPLGITLGIVTSFAFFTLTISYIVKIIPFDPNILRLFAVAVIGFLGLTLVVPKLSQILEGYVSRLSGKFAPKGGSRPGFGGGFLTGIALGVVWSPCAGPILATIATLAATRTVNIQIILVTIVYCIGIGIPLFVFATLGSHFFSKSKFLTKYTGRIQQVFGVIMILMAIAIYTNYDKKIQADLLNSFPSYSNFLLKLEGTSSVTKELNVLKGRRPVVNAPVPFNQAGALPKLGEAPDFVGVTNWLNTDKPLHISDLRGKVVLVDFWTYTCINCIRTLPHVTSLYDKYKDQGFIVIGVHTPEFEFEKNTQNVQNAIKEFKIHYPVTQDNDYATWNAYSNQYWPAEYLIDAQGVIRKEHFGEGEYDVTEQAVQSLLKEAGKNVSSDMLKIADQTPTGNQSSETYLGMYRFERFASNESIQEGVHTYTLPRSIQENYFGYSGTWDEEQQFAMPVKDARLDFAFTADKVFLVVTPKGVNDQAKVYLDGKLVDESVGGSDVHDGVVTFTEPRLYNLIDLRGNRGRHILRLDFLTPGTQLFAFTFG